MPAAVSHVSLPIGIVPACMEEKMMSNRKVWKVAYKIIMPVNIPMSPTRLTMNAFLAASEADFFSNQ